MIMAMRARLALSCQGWLMSTVALPLASRRVDSVRAMPGSSPSMGLAASISTMWMLARRASG